MIKEFRKYDRESQRTVRIKTKDFNTLLAKANAAVRVVPYDVAIRNQYNAYLQTCKDTGKKPVPKAEYEEWYFFAACCFEVYKNAPAEILISNALDVAINDVVYAKDQYDRVLDELVVTYSART